VHEAVGAYEKALEIDPGNANAAAGLKEAGATAGMYNLIFAAILVIAAGLVIWYVKFRKPEEIKTAGKGRQKK